MAESFRESVPMGLVRPSGTNPRREMGDLHALARSIEATGGQPVCPIVVVPDGGVYRIVDGERRWRAMRELGAERVDCVVVDGYDDADELVAMMATDDKLRLSDEERARGTQRMLRLDVPEGRAAGALGSTEERVRRARRVVREAPEQASMGTLLAAADESFSEEERRRVLSRPNAAAAEREAGHIREEHAAAEADALIRRKAGDRVTYGDGDAPTWDPEGHGLIYLGTVSGPSTVAKVLAKAPEGAAITAYPRQYGKPGYELFCADPDADERKAADAEARRIEDGLTEDRRESMGRMASWAVAAAIAGKDEDGELVPWPKGNDPFLGRSLSPYQTELLDGTAVKAVEADTPSGFEIVDAVTSRASTGLFFMRRLNSYAARRYVEAYDWCSAHGWRPGDADAATRAAIEMALADEAREASDGTE